MQKLRLSLLGMALFVAACGPNLSSSELKETSASDLKITTTVWEKNGSSLATVDALMKTIPDDVGIEFNQGETLSVAVEDASNDLSEDVFFSYDEDIFNIDEGYTAQVTKPPLGKNYQVTYTDVNNDKTTAIFYSQGVSDLLTPVKGEALTLGTKVKLTWTKQDLGSLRVKVYFDTLDGGSGSADFSASDTGSYTLDLGHSYFDEAAPGDGSVVLQHTTSFDEMDGFGDADIDVISQSVVKVVFKAAP